MAEKEKTSADEPKVGEKPGTAEGKGKKVEHKNIFSALSALQGELKPMAKSATVQFQTGKGQVSFKYTPLGEIMSNLYPILSRHGLSVRHEIVKKDNKDHIEAVLTHDTYNNVLEEKEEVEIREEGAIGYTRTKKKEYREENILRSGPVRIYQGDDMKDIGSAITYARRYSLTMLLGIASEDDLDAELFKGRAEAAIGFAYTRAKKSVEEAKTTTDLDKALNVLQRELGDVQAGKPGALGLGKEQVEELIKLGEARKAELSK